MSFKKVNFKAALFVIISFLFCSCKTQELTTKVYRFTHEEFKYPEEKYLKDKKDIGIAFSGGGPRSASLTTGQLRALNNLGILDKVKYISAVSGGAWASICYSYYPKKDSIHELLGIYKKPSELNLDTLKKVPNGKLVESISNAYVLGKYFKYAILKLKEDEIYANILREIYLDPINLGENRYVGYHRNSVDTIINKNDNIKHLEHKDFYTYKNNVPFLIVNGTVVGKQLRSWKLPSMHLEMTPLYTGVSYYNELYKRKIGGGYLETFATDNNFIRKQNNNHLVFKKKKNKFSLGDMMAITGNAPGTWANRIRLGSILGLPEIRFISIPETLGLKNDSKKIKSREFPVADGGNLENLGLIPLLKRNVKNIIVFINSKQAIEVIIHDNGDKTIKIDNALRRVFDLEIKDISSSISSLSTGVSTLSSAILQEDSWYVNFPIGLFSLLASKDIKKNYIINTNLLGNNNNEYLTLAKALYNKKINGEALIYTDTYTVNRNPDYGIYPIKDKKQPEADKVNITWIYNDGFDEIYVDKLNTDVKYSYYQKGFNINKSVFPHLPTWNTSSSFRALDYETEWANLLSHFSSWVVMDNVKTFEKIFNMKLNDNKLGLDKK